MTSSPTWRVAIVGAGPAAMYCVEHLLEQDEIDVQIDVYERLPTVWGLVRNGVAPDHPEKKLVIDRLFSFLLGDPRVRLIGATEIGRDISHDELASWYCAVIYAVGANTDMRLKIPGEDLPGSVSARDFIGWCAGHPDYSHMKFDFSCERAVIVGNGNVALDVARMLTLPLAELERTDAADHALAALRTSRIREVVIMGRRDRNASAFNNAELEELEHLHDVDVAMEGDEEQLLPADAKADLRRKLATFSRMARRSVGCLPKRITLRFLASPVALRGSGRVEEMLIMRNCIGTDEKGMLVAKPTGETSSLSCGLVIRAVGYRGKPIPGLPFDEERAVIANDNGRLVGDDGVLPGRYVVGWAKRGCRGIIGSNKKCARGTVRALLADIASGGLRVKGLQREAVMDLVRLRHPRAISRDGWNAINHLERNAGRAQGRPRVKITDLATLLDVAARHDAGVNKGGVQ